ncbi:hypothetical protein [Tannerella forsythia]|uniref:Glycosyltransferase RgtA/B/C/D-like domain-containing protein n=1 Tax=Tannerella forsythia TaxID=28112 RepID=A0A3P1XKM8_TANFO|nr:hypothetical protein [Tannerella forsythia]RRD59332.1 hypothetical protein EII40_10155 [Tannerella forsythia]
MNGRHTKIFYILAGIFSIIYFSLVWFCTDNIPYWDDYIVEQNFLVQYLHTDSLSEKVKLLLQQHNEHRLLFTRSVTLMTYFFTGKLHYSFYIFLANAMFLGIGVLMYQTVQEGKKAFGAFLIALLLFSGQHLETSNWAMSGLTNIGILFLAFSSLYCLISGRRYFIVAGFLLSGITIFSNGNGMFVIFPALICLFLQRRIKIGIAYTFWGVLLIACYFYNYTRSARTDIDLIEIISHIPSILLNTCTFGGLTFWIPSLRIISIVVGTFCFSVFIWGLCKKWYKTNLFCYACLTFLYLSAGAVAVVWFTGGEIAGALRYRVYSTSIFTFTLLLLISQTYVFSDRRLIYLSSFAILLFNSYSMIYVLKEKKRMEWRRLSAYHWKQKGKGLAISSDETIIPYLKEAERMNLYKMPKYPLSEYAASTKKVLVKPMWEEIDMPYQIENISKQNGWLIIEGWAYLKNKSMNFSDIYIYLINQESQYLCTSFSERRYDLNLNAPLDRIEHCGFFTVADIHDFKKGSYQVGIKIKRLFDRKDYNILTDEIVEI